jgi:hypothetical protein
MELVEEELGLRLLPLQGKGTRRIFLTSCGGTKQKLGRDESSTQIRDLKGTSS